MINEWELVLINDLAKRFIYYSGSYWGVAVIIIIELLQFHCQNCGIRVFGRDYFTGNRNFPLPGRGQSRTLKFIDYIYFYMEPVEAREQRMTVSTRLLLPE